MSRGLPRLNITVTPGLHAQVQALAKSREETLSDLLRHAIESWDERRALRVERKSKALSVRFTDTQRSKLARIAKRTGLPASVCMALLLEHLVRTLAQPAAPERAAPKPATRQRKQPGSGTAEKQPTPRQRKRSAMAAEQPAQRKPQKTPAASTTRARAQSAKQTPGTRTRSKTKTAAPKPTRAKRASRAGTEPAALDLPAFAKLVQNIADTETEGRFGASKVFISSAWRRLEGTPLAGMSLDAFKRALVDASRANLLTLARADLIAAMDPVKVRESQTAYLNALFHFIESPRRG